MRWLFLCVKLCFFLEKENYKDSVRDNTLFSYLRISLKGLSILNKTPNELQNKKSYGVIIKEAVKSGSKVAINEVIVNLIATILKDR